MSYINRFFKNLQILTIATTKYSPFYLLNICQAPAKSAPFLRAVNRLSDRKSHDLVRHLDISVAESIPTNPVELDHDQESPESIQTTQAKINYLNLTQKQQDVLSYRTEGLSYAKIGMAMSIGEGISFQILKKM